MKKFSGMVAAMPTPFKEDESIDFAGVGQLVRHLAGGGIHGILVGGSTGEYSLMSMEERKELIKTAVEAADRKVFVLAGCSCHRPKDTMEMVRYAGDVGADLALVIPPYYLTTTEQGILDYYHQIGENAKIGVVIYHYPAATNVTLSPDLIVKLSKLPNMAGIKDTAEMEHTSQLIERLGDNENFGIINGCEHLIMGTLAEGGDGTMGIVHNLAPRQMREIFDAVQENDLMRAKEINKNLLPLYTLMEEEPYPGPVKAALDMLGLPGGIPRKPVVPPSEGMKERLRDALISAGIL